MRCMVFYDCIADISKLYKRKNWRKRDYKVIERYLKKQKQEHNIYNYLFIDIEAMEKFVAREKYFKNDKTKL